MKRVLIYILIIISISFSGCSGCSESGIRNHNRRNNHSSRTIEKQNPVNSDSTSPTIVKMKKEGGVYYIPAEINGLELNFVFDTGASDITISDTEAMFLYKQGKLIQEDIVGKQEYMIADGTIAEGTVIILRTVKIGNRTLTDVKASIVHNSKAPLLLGQSALSMFGKISIDYDKCIIVFN